MEFSLHENRHCKLLSAAAVQVERRRLRPPFPSDAHWATQLLGSDAIAVRLPLLRPWPAAASAFFSIPLQLLLRPPPPPPLTFSFPLCRSSPIL